MSIYIPNQSAEDERIEPMMKVDTPDGKYALPVVVLADFQIEAIVAKVKEAIWSGVALTAVDAKPMPENTPAPEGA